MAEPRSAVAERKMQSQNPLLDEMAKLTTAAMGLAQAADLSFDGGAHVSREAFSADGGATWLDAFERDANVVILGSLAASPEPQRPAPLPTPVPWFEGTIP